MKKYGENEMDCGFIKGLKKFAENNDQFKQFYQKASQKYNERKKGKEFSLSEHIQAIIYSLLSNQRPWKTIRENKNIIDKIFFDYDIEKIKNTNPLYFVESIRKIRCGNKSIKSQMYGLNDIINVLEKMEKENKTIDYYFNNHQWIKVGYPYYLAEEFADRNNKYKLKNMGVALICEYFKEIGIDIAKPDIHIRRMLGRNILGFSNNQEASPKEAIEYIKEIAEKNTITQTEVDALLWLYCADGFGEICTKDNPKCSECVIKGYCNRNKVNS